MPRVALARLVAAVVLVGLLAGSAALLRFALPAGAVSGPGTGATSPSPTLAPAQPVGAPAGSERAQFAGTILFAREGRIWSVSADAFRAVTNGGRDSWPVWSPDGRGMWFIRTRTEVAVAPYEGKFKKTTLDYPTLMSAAADGAPRAVFNSLIDLPGPPNAKYFVQVVQPSISPDGKMFALASDAANPLAGDVTLSTLASSGGRIRNLGVRSERGTGHNDPAWSPDGRRIAFTYDAGDGRLGLPRIGVYVVASRAMKLIGPSGFANPSWSPDGRHLVVERADGKGRDLAVLDATTGTVVRRLTTDGRSFAPTFSPDGSQIAYLHVERAAADIRILTLVPDDTFGVSADRPVTADGHVDPDSGLSWAAP